MSVAVSGAALILAALTFDATTLLVPGLAFLLLGVLIPAWIWVEARGARAEHRLEATRVIEGAALRTRIRVRRAWPRAAEVEVVDPVGGRAELGRRNYMELTLRFARRGRHRLEPPELRLSDPLGLVALVQAGSSGATSASAGAPGAPPASASEPVVQEILVLPRTEPVQGARGGGRAAWESGLAGTDEPWGASDVEGLRAYRHGTPAARIHWPALARGAGLLERRLRAVGESLPVVVLDPRSGGSSDLVDAAVRAAASLTLELARRRGCELLLPGERRPLRVGRDLAAWPEAHARLALVEDAGPRSAPMLPPGLHGPVVYVTASGRVNPLRRGLGEAILVVPDQVSPPGRGPAQFHVAGCRGYALGYRGRVAAPRAGAA